MKKKQHTSNKLIIGIVVILVVVGAYFFLSQMNSAKQQVQSPAPQTQSTTANQDQSIREKMSSMGFLISPEPGYAYGPQDIPNDGQQLTFEIGTSNILVIKRPNRNPTTGKPFTKIEEFDPRTKNFSSITVDGYPAKRSQAYENQMKGAQEDVLLIKDGTEIWIIQELKPSLDFPSEIDNVLNGFTFSAQE